MILGVGDAPDAQELAIRISTSIDASGFEGRWVPEVHVGTASGSGQDIDAIIRWADTHMYEQRRRHEDR